MKALRSEFGEDAVGIVEEYRNSAEKVLKSANRIKDPIKRRREQAKRQAELDRWTNMYEQVRPKAQMPEYAPNEHVPQVNQTNRELEDETVDQPDDIHPIGQGAFGNIYDQFRGKPQQAIAFLLHKKDGEALGALSHPQIGGIDLVWGKEGTGKSDGFGLAKIAKFHPEVLNNLQEVINSMTVASANKNRMQLESDTHKAAVRLEWDEESKKWLLTAYEKEMSFDSKTYTTNSQEATEGDSLSANDISESKDNIQESQNQTNEHKKESPVGNLDLQPETINPSTPNSPKAIREGGQVLISNHVRQQSYSDLPDNSEKRIDGEVG